MAKKAVEIVAKKVRKTVKFFKDNVLFNFFSVNRVFEMTIASIYGDSHTWIKRCKCRLQN